LYKSVVQNISIPVIASGGMGQSADAVELLENADVDALATASVLHYKMESIQEIKNTLLQNQIKVRI
jgi:cyclase